jgi:hypothetical protein
MKQAASADRCARRTDPRWRAAVEALERALVIEAPAARRFAGMAAEGVIELCRIAQARAARIGELEVGDAMIDALRRLARYEGLAYAKKDKGLRYHRGASPGRRPASRESLWPKCHISQGADVGGFETLAGPVARNSMQASQSTVRIALRA